MAVAPEIVVNRHIPSLLGKEYQIGDVVPPAEWMQLTSRKRETLQRIGWVEPHRIVVKERPAQRPARNGRAMVAVETIRVMGKQYSPTYRTTIPAKVWAQVPDRMRQELVSAGKVKPAPRTQKRGKR